MRKAIQLASYLKICVDALLVFKIIEATIS